MAASTLRLAVLAQGDPKKSPSDVILSGASGASGVEGAQDVRDERVLVAPSPLVGAGITGRYRGDTGH